MVAKGTGLASGGWGGGGGGGGVYWAFYSLKMRNRLRISTYFVLNFGLKFRRNMRKCLVLPRGEGGGKIITSPISADVTEPSMENLYVGFKDYRNTVSHARVFEFGKRLLRALTS